MMMSRLLIGLFTCLLCSTKLTAQRVQLFDDNWLFWRGAAQGAEDTLFNDADWRKVSLPHDWSIEDLPGTVSPFNKGALSQVSGGFTTGGSGWYRKHFVMPVGQHGKRIIIQFDGVYMNAQVWINGKKLGKHPYGYTAFWYDVTPHVRFGKENLLVVKVRNEGENSRWYAGSGIYRHVWLKALEPVHVAQWGTYITTPLVNNSAATVNVNTTLQNETGAAVTATVVTRLSDEKGKVVAEHKGQQQVQAGKDTVLQQLITVKSPALWSVESPVLYKAISQIYVGDQLKDSITTSFGIRTIAVDAQKGFQLNGKTIKLKGGCVHHDNGPLGAKAYDRAEERKVSLLKASGYNAIRCSHNPPSPAFLDACDRLGMLVIDEAFDTWKDGKNPEDYHLYFDDWWKRDIESMVYRDRNHPSIIMWSTGNEIPHREKPEVAKVAGMLRDHIRSIDTTRFITCGVNGIAPDKDAFLSTLDIAGYNYARDQYVKDHERVPQRVMMATESFAIEAYDYWMAVADHPWVIGDFVWTAFDYIGEASIGWLGYMQHQGFYPWNLAYCGDIDICGWKRPQSYYRDVLWKPDQISLFVKPPKPSFDTNTHKVEWSHWEWYDARDSWNWEGYEGKPLEVSVYTSYEEAELFLNGVSLGRRKAGRENRFMAVWQVPYSPGKLTATGYKGKQKSPVAILSTAGKAAQIKLTADRQQIIADGQDLSYVTVELTDADGNRLPNADDLVKFEIVGPGSIAGVGNANPMSVESYQLPQRKAWQGRCLAIIKADKAAGNITLQVTAAGLPAAQLTITSTSAHKE
ncbi:glycoside hydrolase family 2 TIM barrel-domain containing protein [Chitinophaga sp. CF418]|uniref:glycoside hydrolase family 2 TIM barrel-domain containing protein n=1 Tax=Chitinophaga sp. CF418 TaxID=1855287 RepID=UPI001CB8754F|nr:glycoside hydrolase family 2 TIM barrel-domain containing protein [Chitinophaga sp. CF418]